MTLSNSPICFALINWLTLKIPGSVIKFKESARPFGLLKEIAQKLDQIEPYLRKLDSWGDSNTNCNVLEIKAALAQCYVMLLELEYLMGQFTTLFNPQEGILSKLQKGDPVDIEYKITVLRIYHSLPIIESNYKEISNLGKYLTRDKFWSNEIVDFVQQEILRLCLESPYFGPYLANIKTLTDLESLINKTRGESGGLENQLKGSSDKSLLPTLQKPVKSKAMDYFTDLLFGRKEIPKFLNFGSQASKHDNQLAEAAKKRAIQGNTAESGGID
uniref:Uncharacterized protein n=1 Tax=Cyanophora sudae TaxID=1522369 RepID=A0A873WYI2_9EUKA|nr:hypothetical protein DXZ12_mgp39 [Cyanophora sudae]QPB15051.1 hypothetical protein [Cyanophora sudae]